MFLKVPEGLGNFSHNATEYKVKDGLIEVTDAAAIAVAKEFGYTEVSLVKVDATEDDKVDEVDSMKKTDLLAYVEEHSLEVPANAKVADLRELVRKHKAAAST